jgi:hypothetical protein
MGYNDSTHLAKFQWDIIHERSGETEFESAEEVIQKASEQQLRDALKYYNSTKLLQDSAKFKNIPAGIINSQIKERLDNYGKPIQQGGFFLCGPAAACYIAAYHDPEKYVKTIFDLYMTGRANDGKIKGNDAIYNVTPNKSGYIDGIPVVDWMLLNCLRYSENFIDWGKYNPHIKDDINKMTTIGEFKDIIERLNISVSIEDEGSIEDTTWMRKKIMPWFTNTKVLVFFVNSKPYNDPNNNGTYTYEGFWDQLVSENYGRHFITVHNISLNRDGSITIEFWDRGFNKQENGMDVYKKKTFKNYVEFKAATFKYWLIKNTANE